jgi:uncharacterized protein (TIGR03435 family)
MNRMIRFGFALMLGTGAALAQTAAPLAFEVATVKPAPPVDMAKMRAGTAHVGTKIDAARVDIGGTSLFRLICTAYRLKPYQVSGPDWMKTSTYDIQAKIPDGMTAERVPEMLQTLLVERFDLKFHRDSKEQPVYALVVAKGGPKLKEAAPQPVTVADTAAPSEKAGPVMMSLPTAQGDVKLTRTAQGMSIEMPGGEISGKIHMSVTGGTPPKLHLESAATTMKTFAELLSVGVVDRPVTDMTGLTGTYDVGVDLSQEDAMNVARAAVNFAAPRGGDGGRAPEGASGAAGVADPSGASIYGSLRDLGLRLEPRKVPMDRLVIDSVEKTPTSN